MYYLNTDEPLRQFEKSVNSRIFVDKSLLIEKITQAVGTASPYLCITRPRRFGKTVNANMLGAYYTKGYDSHALFDSLAIAGTQMYEKHLNRYNVIHIDFGRQPDSCEGYDDYIGDIIKTLQELKQWYDGYRTSTGKSLYNPRSASMALMRGVCLNYWTQTGPVNEIEKYEP